LGRDHNMLPSPRGLHSLMTGLNTNGEGSVNCTPAVASTILPLPHLSHMMRLKQGRSGGSSMHWSKDEVYNSISNNSS
jgi:hypothetical protein